MKSMLAQLMDLSMCLRVEVESTLKKFLSRTSAFLEREWVSSKVNFSDLEFRVFK
jgi:hypothetical protein